MSRMQCPKCQAALSQRVLWLMWNPYRFSCPHCHATLAMRHATRQLLAVALLVGVVGGTAVALIVSGRWQDWHGWALGVLYFGLGLGLPITLWHRGRFALVEKAS